MRTLNPMKLSVVVPCYNEEEVLPKLAATLLRVLPTCTEQFEVIFIDDGSSDQTVSVLRELSKRDAVFRYVVFSRNFGKESAMLSGIEAASGDAIAIMDADMQHPPELLPRMLPLLDANFDQVVAKRNRVGDARTRKFLSKGYYKAVNHFVDVSLEDGVGDFRVLSRRAADAILSLHERNRFAKGLFAWIGFDTAYVNYENSQRAAGESKWSVRQLLNYGLDGVFSFNSRPLRAALHIGLYVTIAAVLYVLWVVVRALAFGVSTPGYATLMAAVVGFGGLQILILGILGEYVGRIYDEVKARPHFIIKETSVEMAPVLEKRVPSFWNG